MLQWVETKKYTLPKFLPKTLVSALLSSFSYLHFHRENGSSTDEAECSNTDKSNCERDGDHKRKPSEVVSGKQYPNKSPKVDQGDQLSSPNKSKGSFKKPKGEKLDWNILRPTKNQNKRG